VALPLIADVYRCAFKWSDPAFPTNAVNVMHFKKSGSNPAAIATILNTNVTAAMWYFQEESSVIGEVDITPLDGTSVTYPYIPPVAANWAGERTTSDKIPNVANLIKLVTAKRGRSYRGRVFLPWVHEGSQTNGVLDAAAVSNCTAAWVAFLAAMSSSGAPLQVASYLHATSEPVVAVICERDIATQRRRNSRISA
jgi:hypothetical protein